MSLYEVFVLALGLSMDAFAVAVCKGLSMKRMNWGKACVVGAYFGGFQGGMPCLGYLLAIRLSGKIESIDHWIAFFLLGFLGVNMILESKNNDAEKFNDKVDVKTMTLLAVATSIDALAVGITLAFLQVELIPSVLLIGATTFVLSMIGVKIGNVFGKRYQSRAEAAGGVMLILIGTKILLEHLGFIG